MKNELRRWMRIVESPEMLKEYRPPDGGIGFHGTCSRFAGAIIANGFLADPELKTYDENFTSYSGTYFSDSFTVALQRGGITVEKFGGENVVFICSITQATAGDEDAIIAFIQQDMFNDLPDDAASEWDEDRYKTDDDYRDDFNEFFGSAFEQYFDERAPSDFFDLVLYIENGGNVFDAHSRALIDRISRAIGPATPSNGNSDARSFRVSYKEDHSQLDPSALPSGFNFKTIYGTFRQIFCRILNADTDDYTFSFFNASNSPM